MTPPPPLILMNGDWDEYLSSVYEHYVADLIDSPRHLLGKPVRARYNPATNGKGFSFWHVISEGEREEDRTPDLRRCERIQWIAWMLVHAAAGEPKILSWKNSRTTRRGTTERLVLLCEEAQYVVILEERAEYFLLVSAYPVSERRSEKLRKEWAAAQK